MTWILVTILIAVVLYVTVYRRGERALSLAERARMRGLLETVLREQAEEPFERFELDIGSGQETFLIGETDAGAAFRISRENRTPRLRPRRYWMYLPGETLAQDAWATFLSKGEYARLIDHIFDAPPSSKEEPPPAVEKPPEEAKAEPAPPASEPAPAKDVAT